MARKPFSIHKFKGLDNRNAPESIITVDRDKVESFASIAMNVDFDSAFGAARRKGWALSVAGDFHSLWANPDKTLVFVAKDSQVGLLDAELTFTPLLTSGIEFFSYADTGAGVYFSNGRYVASYAEGVATELSHIGGYDFQTSVVDPTDDATAYDATPPGTLLSWMFGRLWVVIEEGAYFSRGFRPDQFNLADDYIALPNIKMVMPTHSGYFIGTDSEVFYINGKNPKQPNPTNKVCDFGVVPRSAALLPASQFGGDLGAGDVVVWESPRGKVIGTDGGAILLPTDEHIAYPSAEYAATLLREINGEVHHVAALAQPSTDGSNMRATDIAVAEVVRNGITI
jgi:hypothetical protein